MSSRRDLLVTRFKAAADGMRLRSLALCRHGECSVSELTTVLGLSQPRMSQQLKVLCDAGLLQRFRDGQRVFYRWPQGSTATAELRQLLALLPADDPDFAADALRLRELRGSVAGAAGHEDVAAEPRVRALHRAILDLTVTQPVGDLLDVGCGRGQLLKLLASRASRAIGVDIDAGARHRARAELLLAGLNNCSLRQGDMYALPFAAAEFDTIILDDVLALADRPGDVLREAQRVLRDAGRILLLQSVDDDTARSLATQLAGWCAEAGLRLAPARRVPAREPLWLLAEARPVNDASAAA